MCSSSSWSLISNFPAWPLGRVVSALFKAGAEYIVAARSFNPIADALVPYDSLSSVFIMVPMVPGGLPEEGATAHRIEPQTALKEADTLT